MSESQELIKDNKVHPGEEEEEITEAADMKKESEEDELFLTKTERDKKKLYCYGFISR